MSTQTTTHNDAAPTVRRTGDTDGARAVEIANEMHRRRADMIDAKNEKQKRAHTVGPRRMKIQGYRAS